MMVPNMVLLVHSRASSVVDLAEYGTVIRDGVVQDKGGYSSCSRGRKRKNRSDHPKTPRQPRRKQYYCTVLSVACTIVSKKNGHDRFEP